MKNMFFMPWFRYGTTTLQQMLIFTHYFRGWFIYLQECWRQYFKKSIPHISYKRVHCSFKTEFDYVKCIQFSTGSCCHFNTARGKGMSCSWRASVKSSQSQVSITTVWNMHWVSLYSTVCRRRNRTLRVCYYQMKCSSTLCILQLF